MNKIKFIAEIGWNHKGCYLVERMIKAASKAVDYAKFQTWKYKI